MAAPQASLGWHSQSREQRSVGESAGFQMGRMHGDQDASLGPEDGSGGAGDVGEDIDSSVIKKGR